MKKDCTVKLCSPGRRARLGALGVGRVRRSRAVKGSLGHSPEERYGESEGLDAAVKIVIIRIRRWRTFSASC